MREGQLFITGSVGALLLAGLIALIGFDIAHRPPRPRADAPVAAQPVQPDCCDGIADPIGPEPTPVPILPFLAVGEVPMELRAIDRGLTLPLSAEQVKRLQSSLSLVATADVPSPSVMLPLNPQLQVLAHTPAGTHLITLNNRERLEDSQAPHRGWSMPPGLWDEVASWLPPEISQPGQLSYLLRAELLREESPQGPITYSEGRAALIARLLLEGREIDLPNDLPTEATQFTLTFIVEGAEYRVHLRPNSFTVGRHTYTLKEAALIVGANLHAN